ncbi:hypothetical protein NDU88_002695 [Pleurodeles waltl]|uniref:Uncharacterized protein n=1 Tax=Pleurodeles waltl TaxID=8319 RepID=A0AAV7LEV4_PLEWA|nr:hypothetical protein NDU88_002695 [Pleurodeles waltl]
METRVCVEGEELRRLRRTAERSVAVTWILNSAVPAAGVLDFLRRWKQRWAKESKTLPRPNLHPLSQLLPECISSCARLSSPPTLFCACASAHSNTDSNEVFNPFAANV